MTSRPAVPFSAPASSSIPISAKLMAQEAIRRHGKVMLVDVEGFADDALIAKANRRERGARIEIGAGDQAPSVLIPGEAARQNEMMSPAVTE
jgi:hypothetical protein